MSFHHIIPPHNLPLVTDADVEQLRAAPARILFCTFRNQWREWKANIYAAPDMPPVAVDSAIAFKARYPGKLNSMEWDIAVVSRVSDEHTYTLNGAESRAVYAALQAAAGEVNIEDILLSTTVQIDEEFRSVYEAVRQRLRAQLPKES